MTELCLTQKGDSTETEIAVILLCKIHAFCSNSSIHFDAVYHSTLEMYAT